MNRYVPLLSAVAATVRSLASGRARASSHRDAPAIAEDQFGDATDVYAFISPQDADRLVLVANYVPFLQPSSGPNFYRFSDRVVYDILVDNDGDAISDVRYVFQFETSTADGSTFLYNLGPVTSIDDPNLNVRQTYDLTRVSRDEFGNLVYDQLVDDAPVAPWNVGSNSFPGDSYPAVAAEAITMATDGSLVFAGPRDEPFFADLNVFDILGVGGTPTTDGLNIMSLVLEVPIDRVAAGGVRPTADEVGPTARVGVYARASRPQRTIRQSNGEFDGGGWVQVSRVGLPLTNVVLMPLQDKDAFNRGQPVDDVANFGGNILDPELPALLNAVLGAGCPDTPPEGRLDLLDLLGPAGTTPADLLRIDIRQGQAFVDTQFPNGRALHDDVIDTLLTAVCNSGGVLGDGVDENDLLFFEEMPFLATPHSGNP